MYFIVYGILYIFSLLPFFILYALSDFVYFIMYHIVGYRKKVVFENLTSSFPEKSPEEIKIIAKKFYSGFIDTFFETIKALSITDKAINKRCIGNFEPISTLIQKGKNVQILGAHMFNWEYANFYLSKQMPIPFMSMYSKIENKIFDKLFLKLRSKYNTILIPTSHYNRRAMEVMRNQYCSYLLADQTPGLPQNAYWLNFFNTPAPFINGPQKAAVKGNPSVVFINFRKIKRGYYSFDCETIIENASDFTPQDLTKMYRDFVEKIIKMQPENYLWSHRRWKYKYNETHHHLWIDN